MLAAGALLTGAAGAIGAGIALSAAPANATPEEDCAAVRARDHQIYLNLIASLPPGAPIPPEIINPCLSAPSTTATAAPTTTVGLPGAQAPGGGPNVGANALRRTFPPTTAPPSSLCRRSRFRPLLPRSPASETGVGAFPNASASAVPSPTPTPGEGTTTDRGPGPIPADSDSNIAPAQTVPDPAADVSTAGEDSGRDRYLELVLVGAAAFTAAGMRVRGRPGPFSPRTPESVLSQAVGTVASPLTAYAPGGQSSLRVFDPITGGSRFFFLIHDETSSHESVIPVTVPPGGHMSVNPDGTVTVFDADGNPVSTIDAPWAYDANGTPVPTRYEIRDGQLVQVVDTAGIENLLYPILADPEEESAKAPASVGPQLTSKPAKSGVLAGIEAGAAAGTGGGGTNSGAGAASEPPWNPLDNLDMDPPTQPAPTTPLPFDVGSPTDSGTDTTAGAASQPPWNPLDNLEMDQPTQQDPPLTVAARSARFPMRATTPEQSAAIPTSRSRTRTEPAGRAHPRRCRTCGVGRTPTRRERFTTCRSPTTSRDVPTRFSTIPNSVLSLYDWSTGELILQGEPQALDSGAAIDSNYPQYIAGFVVPLRGARLINGAIRAEDLIVSNRTTPTRPPVTSPAVPAQSVPRPGSLPPRGIPVIDGTVPPAEHDQPSVPVRE